MILGQIKKHGRLVINKDRIAEVVRSREYLEKKRKERKLKKLKEKRDAIKALKALTPVKVKEIKTIEQEIEEENIKVDNCPEYIIFIEAKLKEVGMRKATLIRKLNRNDGYKMDISALATRFNGKYPWSFRLLFATCRHLKLSVPEYVILHDLFIQDMGTRGKTEIMKNRFTSLLFDKIKIKLL